MSVFLRFRSVAVGSAAGTPSAESYMYRVIGANARCTGSSVRTLHAHYMHTRSAQTSPRPRQHQTRQTRSDQTDPNLDISHKVKTTPPITKQHTTLRTIIPTTNLSLKHPVPLITIPILLDRTKTTHLSMYISAARTQRRIPHVLAEAAVSNAAAAVADRQPQRGISVEARGKRSLNRATTRKVSAYQQKSLVLLDLALFYTYIHLHSMYVSIAILNPRSSVDTATSQLHGILLLLVLIHST
ncbi:uncharacterized protein SETTUDRAFT_37805 [Exserohilum turcica Et28A]|uniref:Uncharacterized protein n=1 Tax=Exserohilum turcicum (strain 28A) TaxID=671987 RepID=R0IXI2_EXST2|nr:uncharacterized protein SETTUDRAFT_37805 [Exserohilum turcica Et28A]EOA89286.1 hypothetical protein SETTUDRAFT_37805 [Exserohilum turcica Et28A]